MNDNDKIRLQHILEAMEDIESFVVTCNREEFLRNKLIQSAVVRQFEIIGEASGALSQETQSQYSNIPWRIMKNFRNVLIHQYFGVDYNEVYTVIENELHFLKSEIYNIVN
ncbi:MAG: DUF86 domain-containing protein [Leptospiraceae bacterium]|nr:DUF86 domain-containing protein [Leptospiraceae bacterium]